jgi:hypothetical protein
MALSATMLGGLRKEDPAHGASVAVHFQFGATIVVQRDILAGAIPPNPRMRPA